MIRNTLAGLPARRIAVIEISRPQKARMGSISNGQPARGNAVAWTTISDERPESSANFLASVITKQNYARTATAGTLTYTPANTTPAPNVAPWNSWIQPNCPNPLALPVRTPDAQTAIAPAAAAPAGMHSKLWLLAGLMGAAASVKYLMERKR